MSDFVELMKRGGNQAITINKPDGVDFHLTSRGSDWLWAAFCIFMVLAIIQIGLMFRKPPSERLFYYTAIAPLIFMMINYFTLASNLGWIPVKAKYNHVKTSTQKEHPGYRQVFYTRYIGWFMAFPWPIIQASLLGCTPTWQIAFNVGLTETWVVALLIAAVVKSTYKWGYFSFAVAAGVVCSISVMTTTRNLVKNMGQDVFQIFTAFYGVVMGLWGIYPICFGVSEGGNAIQPNSEAVFYGVLDVLLLGVVPCLFVALASSIGLDRLGYGQNAASSFSPMPHEKTMNSIASARNSGETAVSTPKATPKPAAKKGKKSKK